MVKAKAKPKFCERRREIINMMIECPTYCNSSKIGREIVNIMTKSSIQMERVEGSREVVYW
jgi:hypothetical protein